MQKPKLVANRITDINIPFMLYIRQHGVQQLKKYERQIAMICSAPSTIIYQTLFQSLTKKVICFIIGKNVLFMRHCL